MLYLCRVQLHNVRCFERVDISLDRANAPAGWTLILGDNSTGKSTLLRSIAMGLCDEASAAGLLKESDEGYIRRGASEATILVTLRDTDAEQMNTFKIKTTVSREEKRRGIFADRVRQTTYPRGSSFPWDRLFVSGYGAGRGVSGTGDISSYSAIDAVYNMFNYTEGLQNPELVMRRLIDRKTVNANTRQVFQLLRKAIYARDVRLTTAGIRIDGPWGEGMPLRDLADGYRSSFLWITDLLGWALAFQPRTKTTASIRGIVLVDELEQHLHARWQRTVVDDLRHLFPHLQFLVTTHSPLIASSVGPRAQEPQVDQLLVLEATGTDTATASPHGFMRGWSMDQVLASRAFKYQIDADPEVERALLEASRLATKPHRTQAEESHYQRLVNVLRDTYLSSTSPIGRDVETAVRDQLRHDINRMEALLFDDAKK